LVSAYGWPKILGLAARRTHVHLHSTRGWPWGYQACYLARSMFAWAQHVIEYKYIGYSSLLGSRSLRLNTWLNTSTLSLIARWIHVRFDLARGWPRDTGLGSLLILCLFRLSKWMNPSMLSLFRQRFRLFNKTIKKLTCHNPSTKKKALSSFHFLLIKKQNGGEKTWKVV